MSPIPHIRCSQFRPYMRASTGDTSLRMNTSYVERKTACWTIRG